MTITNEPSTSININWTALDIGIGGAKVVVWSASKYESTASFDAAVETRSVSNSLIAGVTKKNFYTAAVTGLSPNTLYNYRIISGSQMSEVRSFKTAPENKGRFTFLNFADSQAKAPHSLG